MPVLFSLPYSSKFIQVLLVSECDVFGLKPPIVYGCSEDLLSLIINDSPLALDSQFLR